MNVSLENEFLRIEIIDKGAELKRVENKRTGLDYLWSGDPAFWGKTSPLLFPIVGTLKDNTYIYEGKPYQLSRHGFARDSMFQLESQNKDEAIFLLQSNAASRESYPFDFELRVTYRVTGDTLHTTYNVRNTGDKRMLFSIGAHPAFKVPLASGARYDAYYLEFSENENLKRWPISEQGLIKNIPVPFLTNSSVIHLTRTLFNDDAIVFKNPTSAKISLRAETDSHGLDFDFHEFPYLGIWAAKNADFVCIEPWCGIADAVSHDQQLETKEGIEKLAIGDTWSRSWSTRFY